MTNNHVSGTGLPGFENFYLNLFFRIGCVVTSDHSVLRSFESTSREILGIVDQNDIGVLSQQIAIPRLQGIEDASCNWSVLMVLKHLSMVNRTIMEIIRSLRSNTEPFHVIEIENFKPHSDVGAEAIEEFREANQKYWAFAKSHIPLRSQLTYAHPWFGQLDGHRWHCLAAAHQKIHRRQIYKVLAMIGVT